MSNMNSNPHVILGRFLGVAHMVRESTVYRLTPEQVAELLLSIAADYEAGKLAENTHYTDVSLAVLEEFSESVYAGQLPSWQRERFDQLAALGVLKEETK